MMYWWLPPSVTAHQLLQEKEDWDGLEDIKKSGAARRPSMGYNYGGSRPSLCTTKSQIYPIHKARCIHLICLSSSGSPPWRRRPASAPVCNPADIAMHDQAPRRAPRAARSTKNPATPDSQGTATVTGDGNAASLRTPASTRISTPG